MQLVSSFKRTFQKRPEKTVSFCAKVEEIASDQIMKWNSSSFLENRTFDQRLVKENLIDKWNVYGDIYKTRTDYRQFLESYVIIFYHFDKKFQHVILQTFTFYSSIFVITFENLCIILAQIKMGILIFFGRKKVMDYFQF